MRLAIESANRGVEFRFKRGKVGGGVCLFESEDLFDQIDDGLLLIRGHVRNGEFFPVVGVEVNVAAAVRAEEVAGAGGVHYPEQVFHGEAAAGGFQFLALRQVEARRLFATVASGLFQRIVADVVQ